MNKIYAYLKKASTIALAAMSMYLVLQSCDSAIYDYEGDCSVTYRMKFVYDKNMKWADAFSNEIKSIRLYAFDADGNLVWQKTESGSILAEDGYTMTMDLPSGEYDFIAWAGLDNEDASETHFSVAEELTKGDLRLEDLKCSLIREHIDGKAVSQKRLQELYHGMTKVNLPDLENDGGTFDCKMFLTKNTNSVHIILQQLSGEDVDVNDFTFTVEEDNGLIAHDNSLLSDEIITYIPHNIRNGSAGLGIDDYPIVGNVANTKSKADAETNISVAIADLTISRLIDGRKTYMTIRRNTDSGIVARVPLVDYALLLKDGYGREMTNQEYLDRQDEYTLTFFLDRSQNWISSSIIINSWKVVLNNVDFQ